MFIPSKLISTVFLGAFSSFSLFNTALAFKASASIDFNLRQKQKQNYLTGRPFLSFYLI